MRKGIRQIEQSFIPRRSVAYDLSKTIADSDYQTDKSRLNLPPGFIWEVRGWPGQGIFNNVRLGGRCTLAWVCNRSGSALSQGALTKWYTNSGTATAGSTSTITDTGQFTADHEVGNYVVVEDNNDAAGGAPEGEFGVIIDNTANIITVQVSATGQVFSVAVAANDTFEIWSDCMVNASAIGDQQREIAGIVLASSLANDYWGWVALQAEVVGALIKADQTVTKDEALIADTGRLGPSSSSNQELILAYGLATIADPDTDFVPVTFRSPYSMLAVSS